MKTVAQVSRLSPGPNGLMLVAVCTALAHFESAVLAQPPQPDPNAVVAATVDGQPILLSEVARRVNKAARGRKIEPEARRLLEAQALEQLIKRRLILRYLQRQGKAASQQDIALGVEQAQQQLQQRQSSLPEFLKQAGLTESEFRRQLAWQIGWKAYLESLLTEANLKRFFERHHQQFDGTLVKVAHILFKVSAAEPAAWDEIMQKAESVAQEIRSGSLDFAQAVAQHSQAPSKGQQGDLGFISRHEPMPESFSQAAFALEVGEISEPVRSPFGIHLIRCTEVKPGQKRWQEVRGPLELAVTRYLFDWVADQERKQADVKFTGQAPHFKPGSDELAR